MGDHYFTFPLAVLHGRKAVKESPLSCINLALNCGMLNAGKGHRHHHGNEAFAERLHEACSKRDIKPVGPYTMKAEALVGAELCGVTLGAYDHGNLQRIASEAESIETGGPLVRMKADFLWAAINQARAEELPDFEWPDHGISWREFRILCAILSMKPNRHGFVFVGWELIKARSSGFANKEAFAAADRIPGHLAPALTRKQIRTTCDTLENLGFFARFRLSTGPRGGLTAYSFRHDRDALAAAVCDWANFRDRSKVKENRAKDTVKCLELLERAKVGPSDGQ
jgi:hypothetical protein